MGLLDSIVGGTPDQSGLSAATKALLLVLAAKAAKDYFTHNQQQSQGATPGAAPPAAGGGGLGGILSGALGGGSGGSAGGLGSMLGGGGLGGLLSGLGGAGALGAVVDQFGKNGHGAAMGSWIGQGANQPIAPDQVAQALGPGPLQELQAKTGLPQQTLLQELAHELPAAIDHLTPQGRLPTDGELASAAQPATRV